MARIHRFGYLSSPGRHDQLFPRISLWARYVSSEQAFSQSSKPGKRRGVFPKIWSSLSFFREIHSSYSLDCFFSCRSTQDEPHRFYPHRYPSGLCHIRRYLLGILRRGSYRCGAFEYDSLVPDDFHGCVLYKSTCLVRNSKCISTPHIRTQDIIYASIIR